MADVQWIRITTDMFDNRKIKFLRKLPDGNNLVLIWVMLLTMAGRCNSGGMIFLTENIPYTPKILADELEFEESTVLLALQTFEKLHMVATSNDFLVIPGWEEYQNVEGLDRIREQDRVRKQRQRERERNRLLESGASRDCPVTVTGQSRQCHGTEEEKEEDKEIDNSSSSLRSEELVAPEAAATPQQEEIERIPYAKVQKLYNDLCPKMAKCTVMSEARKKAIKARFGSGYKLEDFERLFNLAAQSSFLNGGNKRNFMANFDWLIRDANMAKVLDGNYADRPNGNNSPDGGGFTYDYGDMSGSL